MSKTILVTGGSRGIGRGISLELAATGYSVIINYAGNKEAALETKALCQKAALNEQQEFFIIQADISNEEQQDRLINEAFLCTGSLDGLVNNAGVAPKERKELLEMSTVSFDRLMHINLRGPFFLTQKITNRWKETNSLKGKIIVFITSVSGTMVSINRGEYCMSKAGLGMAASLFATRLAPEGALVYEVRPGIIKTDMTSAVESKYDTLLEEGLVPQMRWGTPKDIGKTVSTLFQGSLPFSSGTVISVDGGLAIPRL
jgi:NAD(P)-dependent dehydrogenase (short-subunit alcohol dehydrogenase family)